MTSATFAVSRGSSGGSVWLLDGERRPHGAPHRNAWLGALLRYPNSIMTFSVVLHILAALLFGSWPSAPLPSSTGFRPRPCGAAPIVIIDYLTEPLSELASHSSEIFTATIGEVSATRWN